MSTAIAIIIGTIISAVMGVVGSSISNNLAKSREEEARRENYEYAEMSADKADERTRGLYNDLQSPAALMSQYKQAGLSPSLMLGNGGGSQGASPSQGAQATFAGISPTTYGVSPFESSQIEVNRALAEKYKAETKTTEATRQATLDNILADTFNKEQMGVYNSWKATTEQLNAGLIAQFGEKEANTKLGLYAEQTKLLVENVRSANVAADVSEATKTDAIKQIKANVNKTIAETFAADTQAELAKANITLSKAQVEQIHQKIWQDWQALKLQGDSIKVDRNKLNAQVEQWSIENGLKGKDQAIRIAELIEKYYSDTGSNFAKLLNAVGEIIPF